MEKMFKITGTGCALVDYLYMPVSFTDETFGRYLSVKPGDGGLSPGKLVFTDDFEQFAAVNYLDVRERITNGKPPIAQNIGGPSIVSLIHAAQMLTGQPAQVSFYGSKGRDAGASFIEERLQMTPLQIGKYKTADRNTPFTDVLSDPDFYQGQGERIFINNIGAAWELFPDDLDEAFFGSDMVVFGGTALTPHIHQALCELLKKAKDNHAITVVNTVYDFLNEKKNPFAPWPLGQSDETYQYIDLLITDMEEALRLSGQPTVGEALTFFKNKGTGAVVVTHGAEPVHYYSENRLFGTTEGSKPVSATIRETITRNPGQAGDTTGCGDNFAGGMIASIALQLIDKQDYPVNLDKALALGIASGGYTCFYHGGTFYETFPGQKRQLIEPYYQDYIVGSR